MNEDATLPKKKGSSWLRVIVWIFIIVAVIVLLFPVGTGRGPGPKPSLAMRDAVTIRIALKQYIAEFGTPPIGDEAQVMAALRGKNPRQILFIELDAKRFNARGEFLDPWSHPYRFDASNPEFVWSYSFGKNGIDEGGAEGSDDVASWR